MFPWKGQWEENPVDSCSGANISVDSNMWLPLKNQRSKSVVRSTGHLNRGLHLEVPFGIDPIAGDGLDA